MSVEIDSLMPEVEETPEPSAPEVTVDPSAPVDKEPQARGEDGKFAPKDGKKEKGDSDLKAQEHQQKPPEQKPEHTIPVARYVEERKEWKAEMDAVRKELEALKNPPKAPPPEPVFQDDPKAYTDHKVQTALEALEKQKQEVEQV